jgi:hypothetical protein
VSLGLRRLLYTACAVAFRRCWHLTARLGLDGKSKVDLFMANQATCGGKEMVWRWGYWMCRRAGTLGLWRVVIV